MKASDWMGRYRPLVKALVCYQNQYARTIKVEQEHPGGIRLTAPEWQLLEYLIEHDQEINNLATVADVLGIAPSTLSKLTKSLLDQALVSRYHVTGNRKNIILRPTQAGYDFYDMVATSKIAPAFQQLFDGLEGIPDEYLTMFSDALDAYTRRRDVIYNALEPIDSSEKTSD